MDFVAIDFETANSSPTSACSLGIAVVENNYLTVTKEWYIKPEPFQFDYYNTLIHGITAEDVRNCPGFDGHWDEILSYIGGKTLVAHYAPFDLSVLGALVQAYALRSPSFDYFCSCELSRKVWRNLPNHKLNTVCDHLGIELNHHNACSDAAGSAQIVVKALEELNASGKNPKSYFNLKKKMF
jgi:DNA polymerase-3 subunit epsilon